MATKELLKRLDFRRFAVPAPNVAKITVKYGTKLTESAGHSSARKFVKNYLPALLYGNPGIQASIERSDALNSSPAVIVLKADGSEQTFDTKQLAASFPKAVDREIFRALTGQDLVIPEYKRKKRHSKRAKPAAAAAAGDAEAAGAAAQ